MIYQDRWEDINEEIGEGGQGKVIKVLDKSKINKTNIADNLKKSIQTISKTNTSKDVIEVLTIFRESITDLLNYNNQENYGALKLLHSSKDAKDIEKAKERIKKEIKAMSEISHPNIIEILDYNPDGEWFISKFYQNGTLDKIINLFTGNVVKSLKAIRPLIEGVVKIHESGYVHRDIKPQNIFIDSSNNLILGDFGLVYFTDSQHTRVSGTFENVGSRDWMPPWAMGIRSEENKPSFDVFSLGKLLWTMISGKPILQLWYFEKDENNLEKMFPQSQFINLINPLLDKCIVEKEQNCLSNASELLNEINILLSLINMNKNNILEYQYPPCIVCGIGKYKSIDRLNSTKVIQIQDLSNNKFSKILSCQNCGNIQFFDTINGEIPPEWRKDK